MQQFQTIEPRPQKCYKNFM